MANYSVVGNMAVELKDCAKKGCDNCFFPLYNDDADRLCHQCRGKPWSKVNTEPLPDTDPEVA